jgi:uncharacterized cupin superfamily protein
MPQHKNIVCLADVPLTSINAPEGSLFGGRRQRVGLAIGARKLGYSFFTVPPGKAAFPCHAHTGNEEMIYIIAGNGTLRLGNDELPVSAETVIAFPPGVENAHQLINTGNSELRYLVVSTMEYPDICQYPDSNKVGAYATTAGGENTGFRALFVKDKNVNYYDGEAGKEIERIVKLRRKT